MNLAKWTMVFLFGFCLMNTPIFADNFFDSDTLDCEIESVVFECEGIAADRAAVLAWHQQNIDKLKANCIGHQSGIIIMSSLENLAILESSLCGPCTLNGHYEIIDTVGGMTTIDVKNATFEIVDTSPPVFIGNRYDTIKCNHQNAIIDWLLGKQGSLVVSECNVFHSASLPFLISSQKSEKSETREYSISISDLRGNVADETLYLTILDNTPPMVSCSPSNMVLECNGDIENEQQADLWNQENLIRLANCSREYCSDVFVTSDYDFSNLLNSCGLGGVTYTITDEYENSVIKKATFTIMDINPPTVNCNPLDAFFECKDLSSNIFNAQTWYENNLEVLANCAFDECGDVTITSDFNTDNLTNDCESTGTVLTTFTVADNCGNSITKTATLTFNDNNSFCENILIQPAANQLTISNLSASNTIVKVFDQNYQIIYDCSGDCPETITTPNLNTGEIYHTDIQFYDENWAFICEDKQSIEIVGGSEPCDTSVCQGDVILQTQAEVDAFCGCEVIEGDVLIGKPVGEDIRDIPDTDINNLNSFKHTRIIKGSLVIGKTQLVDLSNLENLEIIENSFVTAFNNQLESYLGLKKLKLVGGLVAMTNPKLENFRGLDSLTKINSNIYINDNQALTSLEGFNQLKTCGSIEITKCQLIKSLEGFNNLRKIERGFVVRENPNLLSTQGIEHLEELGEALVFIRNPKLVSIIGMNKLERINETLAIFENDLLEDISGLENMLFVNNLELRNNPKLDDCCSIVHLMDSDAANGIVNGNIKIIDNAQFCNSIETILQNCQTPPPTCENIQTLTGNNQITIIGLTAPNEIIKVFDKDFNIVYQCIANCEDVQMAGVFPVGDYTVDLQLYDENWELICAEQRTVVLENSNPCDVSGCETIPPVLANIPADITVECDAVPIEPTNITATDNCDSDVTIQFDEVRTDGNCEDSYTLTRTWTAFDDCGNSVSGQQVVTITDLTDPILANVPTDITINENEPLPSPLNVSATDNCDTDVEITVTDTNDGLLNIIIRTFTATDNCGNIATAQQIITIIPDGNNPCEAINITTSTEAITLTNITAPNSIVKVFDANYQIIFDCTATCENELVVPVMGLGIYHTDVQFYDENWGFICEDKQNIEVVDDGEPCDTSACQRSFLNFRTQEGIDAFCGCEVIEGDLVIGDGGNIYGLAEITSLSAFSNLKRVNGNIIFVNATIADVTPLRNLTYIGGKLEFDNIPELTNLTGLENLSFIGSLLGFTDTPKLTNLSALSGLKHIEEFRMTNTAVSSLAFLGNLENDTLLGIHVTNSDSLISLDGLENIESVGSLLIGGNKGLTDLSALKNIKQVENSILIASNPNVVDCCALTHLVDNDLDNGTVGGDITISNNSNFCSSIEEILANCQTQPADCNNVNIATNQNNLSISNLTAPIQIVKVFDNNYAMIYECFGECEETINLADLAAGKYHVNIDFYDENWQPICNKVETVQIGETAQNRSADLLPTDFALYPNPAKTETFIDLSKLKGTKVQLALFNQFGQKVHEQVIEKATEQKAKIEVTTYQNGLYILKIKAIGKRPIAKKMIINRLY